jgi:hypothetical protein
MKLPAALAAGCTVVLKPAFEGPVSAMMLADAIEAAGLPEGVVSVIPGGREVGEHLVRHTDVDKIAFTGSTAAGRRIMRTRGPGQRTRVRRFWRCLVLRLQDGLHEVTLTNQNQRQQRSSERHGSADQQTPVEAAVEADETSMRNCRPQVRPDGRENARSPAARQRASNRGSVCSEAPLQSVGSAAAEVAGEQPAKAPAKTFREATSASRRSSNANANPPKGPEFPRLHIPALSAIPRRSHRTHRTMHGQEFIVWTSHRLSRRRDAMTPSLLVCGGARARCASS